MLCSVTTSVSLRLLLVARNGKQFKPAHTQQGKDILSSCMSLKKSGRPKTSLAKVLSLSPCLSPSLPYLSVFLFIFYHSPGEFLLFLFSKCADPIKAVVATLLT